MIDHTALITEILDHLSGAKTLSKERRAMIAAILKDQSEKEPFLAAARPMCGEIKSVLKALVDQSQSGSDADAAKAQKLSANERWRAQYNADARKRQTVGVVKNTLRNKRP